MNILSQLAEKHRTDKGEWHHGYTPIYHKYFEPIRHKHLSLLEIGIGGYGYPDRGGESLRMWREYFTNAEITGLDLYPKNPIAGCNILQGSQTNHEVYKGTWDIIIDDGSHVCDHIITTFGILWDRLNVGGMYVIEDTETSYWENEYGGGDHDMTTMNWAKRLCDSLNPESGLPNIGIESIHFYKGLIFIFKCH